MAENRADQTSATHMNDRGPTVGVKEQDGNTTGSPDLSTHASMQDEVAKALALAQAVAGTDGSAEHDASQEYVDKVEAEMLLKFAGLSLSTKQQRRFEGSNGVDVNEALRWQVEREMEAVSSTASRAARTDIAPKEESKLQD
eukprot:gnl/MRDRNA2_/MRDRNA2_120293_c0_seq1.p2 gnl/MRDRNA2_/MRDRNA2_120293_c0~~gnl/MRDRNA2_/MRDRNA2_120293_c0_seq1.p2  ORF type:complete len:154 (+),score=44.54 gnl/MRDRNA2_/MRDRNA2_120293_c0_seq1:38-463(+)